MLSVLKPVLLFLSFVAFPVCVRLFLMHSQNIDLLSADKKGAMSDIFISLILLLITIAMPKKLRLPTGAVLILFHAICLLINFEHIVALGISADVTLVTELGNATFFEGSVLNLSAPFLFGLGILGSLVALYFSAAATTTRAAYIAFSLLFLWSGFRTISWNDTFKATRWRQYNIVHESVEKMYGLVTFDATAGTIKKPRIEYNPPEHLRHDVKTLVDSMFVQDLSGTPIIPLKKRRPNILHVMIEGLSGAYLPRGAKPYNTSSTPSLKSFDEIASKGMVFKNMMAFNMQTHRGKYSFFCGDYPNMVELYFKGYYISNVQKDKPVCLPQVLADNGYNTTYLQAAALSYTHTDVFAARVGFQESLGKQWFTKAYRWKGWGADDKAFLEAAVEKIDSLSKEEKPWFMSMLTVGTHHPYLLPKTFKATKHDLNTYDAAIDYADWALTEFINNLRNSGKLKNTVVIVTSDESNGLKHGNDIKRLLSINWIPFVGFFPENFTNVVDQRFTQADFPLSMLDYLGIDPKPYSFIGRSFFRKYDTARPVVVGRGNYGSLGFYYSDKQSIICKSKFEECHSIESQTHDVVPNNIELTEADPAYVDGIKYFLSRSEMHKPNLNTRSKMTLAQPGRMKFHNFSKDLFIIDSSNFELPPKWTVVVKHTVKVISGSLRLHAALTGNNGDAVNVSLTTIDAVAGDTVEAEYRYSPMKMDDSNQVRLIANRFEHDSAEIEIIEASAELIATPDSPPGVTGIRSEVTRNSH